jgi:hypothetical protein
MNKSKDARRRARRHQQRTVLITVSEKIIKDKRYKPVKHRKPMVENE